MLSVTTYKKYTYKSSTKAPTCTAAFPSVGGVRGGFYDAQLGRFWQVDALAELDYSTSVYAFANNNPVYFNDPWGLQTEDPNKANGFKKKYDGNVNNLPNASEGVTVTGTRKKGLPPLKLEQPGSMIKRGQEPFVNPEFYKVKPNFTPPKDKHNATIGPDWSVKNMKNNENEIYDFSLALMYAHFQFGRGQTLTLRMSTIDLSGTSQRELGLLGMKPGDKRDVNLFEAGPLNRAALAFGRVAMRAHGRDQFSIVGDNSSKFDFNPPIDPDASWGRNAGNILGTIVNYNLILGPSVLPLIPMKFGGSYEVNFIGSTYIPK